MAATPGHAAVERILGRVTEHTHSGGPYPLLADTVWTVAGATPNRPARLSLHRRDVLPFTPTQPTLDDALSLPAFVPVTGCLALADGWTLHSDLCARADLPADWRDRAQPWRAFLDADRTGDLALTVPAPGMRIAPLGMGGHTRALGDLFTDHKVPVTHRRAWPVVIDLRGDEVIWVCGLTLSDQAALRPDTRRVRCLTWQKTRPDVP